MTRLFVALAAVCLLTAVWVVQALPKGKDANSIADHSAVITAQADESAEPTGLVEASAHPEPQTEWITVSEQLQPVAEHFAEQIQYPSFSLPILDAQAVEKYKPNQGSTLMRASGELSLALTTSALSYADHVPITGMVSTLVEGNNSVQLDILQQGQVVYSQSLYDITGNQAFTIPANAFSWTGNDVLLTATLTAQQQTLTVSTPIQRSMTTPSSAELYAGGDSEVDGPWLMIPVTVHINNAGFYRVEANLYDAGFERPLIHLSTEEELDMGEQTLWLQAHIQALKAMQDEGDYGLADIVLEQMPSPPDFDVIPGRISLTRIPVKGYPFSVYRDEPYRDQEAIRRLQFLQQADLADGG